MKLVARIRQAGLLAAGAMLAIGAARAGPDDAALAALQDLAREMAEIMDTHGQEKSMAGTIHFVHGNPIWQPGRQFVGGGGWLALACEGTRCALRPANLGVRARSWQGHYDEKPTRGQQLDFKLDAAGAQDTRVVAWFAPGQTAAFLKPGEVPTYALGGTATGTFETVVRGPEGEARFVPLLWSTKEWPASARVQLDRLHPPQLLLQLRMGSRRQLLPGLLATCSGHLRGTQYVLWAGDLDRDGKADYVVSYRDGAGAVHLYLSILAKPDRLVGFAGQHHSSQQEAECDGNELLQR